MPLTMAGARRRKIVGLSTRFPAVVALAAACRASAAAPPPPPDAVARAVKLEVFARGLAEPLGLVFAPGDKLGRIFIVEKPGRVRIAREGRIEPAPFVDIADK